MDMLQFDMAYVNYLIIFLESNVYMCRILGVCLHAYACVSSGCFVPKKSAVFLRVCGLHFYKCLCTNWKYI